MSIPSVSFSNRRQPPQNRTKTTTPTRTRTRGATRSPIHTQRTRKFNDIQNKYQESESSDDSSDVPIIPSTERTTDFISTSLESDTDTSTTSKPVVSGNWNSKKTSVEVAKEEPDEENDIVALPKGKPTRRRPNHSRTVEQDSQDEKPQETVATKEHARGRVRRNPREARSRNAEPKRSASPTTVSNPSQTASENSNSEVDDQPPPDEIPKPIIKTEDTTKEKKEEDNEVGVYSIIREKHLLGDPNFLLKDGERVLLAAVASKDPIGHVYVICDKEPVEFNSPGFVGFVRVEEKYHKFVVVSSESLDGDDRDAELLGVDFNKGNSGRQMTIALPADGKPHYPISRRLSLMNVASDLEAKPGKFIRMHTEQKETDDYGSEFVKPSMKNFVLYDHDRKVFVVYKISEDNFTVKCASPLTKLTAFGLAIASIISQ